MSQRNTPDERFGTAAARLLDAVTDGYWEWHLASGAVYLSPRWLAALGYGPTELPHHVNTWQDLVHPEDRSAVMEAARACAGGQQARFEIECRLRRRDGGYRWYMRHGSITERDSSGAAVRMLGTDVEITRYKDCEAALRETERQIHSVFDEIPVMIHCIDSSGHLRMVNQEWERKLGWSLEESQQRDILAEFYPDPRDQENARRRIAEASGEWHDCRMRLRDGRELDTSWAYVRLADGTRVGVGQDITARKRAEEALYHSEERFRVALKNSPITVFTQDLDLRYTWIHNIPAPTTPERVLGKTDAELLGREEAARLTALKRQVIDSGTGTREEISMTVDGRTRVYDLTIEPLRDAGGAISGITCAATEVTQQRALEHELRRAQKMEAIGRLAGGIAHDFNNVLTAILGNADLVTSALRKDPVPVLQVRSFLDQIVRASQRAGDLTRQLLAFSRRQPGHVTVLDLNRILTELQPMVSRLIGEHIRLEMDLAPDLLRVRADAAQLEQVIVNLIVNARDAMPEGGRLLLKTDNVPSPQPLGKAADAGDASSVLFTVTDTGVGMSHDVLDHIFEPFFTTKPAGKGTGLGLSTVYGIVTQFGGHITVDSTPGQGTTFRIRLPASNEQVPAPEVPTQPQERAGHETILLCEDEPMLRALARRVLEQAGYRVLAAEDAEQALRLAQEHTGPIHLLLTDVVLPGAGGRKLAELLQARRPDLQVIYSSGYTAEVLDRQGLGRGDVDLLQKPFRPRELLRKLREVLDRDTPA